MKKLLKNKKLNLIFFTIGIILILCTLAFIYHLSSTNYLLSLSHRSVKRLGKNLGTFAEICFFVAIGLFVLRLIFKNITPNRIQLYTKFFSKTNTKLSEQAKGQYSNSIILTKIRKIVLAISKVFQKLHVPIAIIACSIIIIHAYIFLFLGFRWNVGYILGILALTDLVLMIITGLFRIFNKGIKIHKILGILFIILMILHIALV